MNAGESTGSSSESAETENKELEGGTGLFSTYDGYEEREVDDDDDNNHDVSSSAQYYGLSQLSQTDEQIRMLERGGELNEIVGSQSMLSQELIHSSQTSAQDDNDVNDDHKNNSGEANTDGPAFQLSQPSESSLSMARRLGLIAQEAKSSPTKPSASGQCDGNSMNATEEDEHKVDSVNKTPPSEAMKPVITDTPFRESECFGSLLEAVEKISKEEELNAKMIAWQHNNGITAAATSSSAADESAKKQPERPESATSPRRSSTAKRKSSTPSSSGSPSKKTRKSTSSRKKEREQRKAQAVAKRAAALAQQTITDPDMAKKLLLSMALVRENPRSVPTMLPAKGAMVPEGFFWAHYPPLEAVLKEHMAQYYDLSTTKCQSAQQQAFNNDLVVLVRAVATQRGWKFHPNFTDKGLRDRIRCYYKTHIQNAKKRLRTMVRNPTKRANARHLCAHLDLIEKHNLDNSEEDDDDVVDDKDRLSSHSSLSDEENSKTMKVIEKPESETRRIEVRKVSMGSPSDPMVLQPELTAQV